MVVIICGKYGNNRSRTENVTERTQFSKSRSNGLEDIGQGQRSSHATHPLMLLIICTKYRKNPSWTVDATGRTRKVNGQTDRQTDRWTDRQGESNISPLTSLRGGYKNMMSSQQPKKANHLAKAQSRMSRDHHDSGILLHHHEVDAGIIFCVGAQPMRGNFTM